MKRTFFLFASNPFDDLSYFNHKNAGKFKKLESGATALGQEAWYLIWSLSGITAVIILAIIGLRLIWNNKHADIRNEAKDGVLGVCMGLFFVVAAVFIVSTVVSFVS